MPIIKLSNRQYMIIDDLLDEFSVDFDFKRTSRDLNHAFAKIYGYKGTKHFRRNAPSKIVRSGRKLSAWQKFIKANSKKPRFKLRSGKLNLKAMGIAYRKTAAYKRNQKK